MHPIEVRHRIDSETLTLPELRPFIGRHVRITVVDVTDGPAEDLVRASHDLWNPPGLDELIRRQGVKPATDQSHVGSFSADDFDGFDEWLDEVRRSPRVG